MNTTDTNTGKPRFDTGAATLWASAFVIMAMIITQASNARLGKEARADVTSVGSLTVTNIQAREDSDILMIMNDAQERLYIYSIEQGRSLSLLQTQDIAEIFQSARR
ncbi:MAG: hypothetical protein ACIAQF_04145 [Phycisphaerales bacterium JB065]